MFLSMLLITAMYMKKPEGMNHIKEDISAHDLPEFHRRRMSYFMVMMGMIISLIDYHIWRIVFHPIVP